MRWLWNRAGDKSKALVAKEKKMAQDYRARALVLGRKKAEKQMGPGAYDDALEEAQAIFNASCFPHPLPSGNKNEAEESRGRAEEVFGEINLQRTVSAQIITKIGAQEETHRYKGSLLKLLTQHNMAYVRNLRQNGKQTLLNIKAPVNYVYRRPTEPCTEVPDIVEQSAQIEQESTTCQTTSTAAVKAVSEQIEMHEMTSKSTARRLQSVDPVTLGLPLAICLMFLAILAGIARRFWTRSKVAETRQTFDRAVAPRGFPKEVYIPIPDLD